MTFGSLFAGIGGFDLGFERAGMECKWQVEIDPFCQKVLAKHWPNVRRWGDVRTFPPEPVDDWRVDVICGGFPCQDISYAGRGAGLAGKRSGLFYEAMRIVGELGPRFVVLENVAALLVRGIDQVLGTLASFGFDAEWHYLPASAFGAPHRRERIFVIAYANGDGLLCGPVASNVERMRSVCRWSQAEYGFGSVSEALQSKRLGDFTGVQRMDDGIPDGLDRCEKCRLFFSRFRCNSPDECDCPRCQGTCECPPDKLRNKGLGNAVVPQVAEWIARRIIESTKGTP